MNTYTVNLPQHVANIKAIYEKARTVSNNNKLTTVNELTDQLPALRPENLRSAIALLMVHGPIIGNKILVEEDKGALFAGVIALRARKPLAMARWYTYTIPTEFGANIVPFRMEYAQGQMLVNGIKKGDRITILDDTLSTGGTLLSLINAVRAAGAEVVDIRVVVEKIGFGGREFIQRKTGLSIKAAIGIRFDTEGEIIVTSLLDGVSNE